MLKKISRARLDALRQGWLESRRHLPAARFGPLTALDDSLIRPHTGFNTHPDKNEVLLYYIANGELTHGDSLNNHSVSCAGAKRCACTRAPGCGTVSSTRAARRCVWSGWLFRLHGRAAHPTMESSAFCGKIV
ncbi:MAG: hypothetical protein ACLR7U_11720 [Ruthenibacterium lactatiformans]